MYLKTLIPERKETSGIISTIASSLQAVVQVGSNRPSEPAICCSEYHQGGMQSVLQKVPEGLIARNIPKVPE